MSPRRSARTSGICSSSTKRIPRRPRRSATRRFRRSRPAPAAWSRSRRRPFSGDTAGFSSMAALGAAPGEPPPLMFRRSREDVGDPRRRRHRFAGVRITRAESRLQRLLERYSRDVWRDAPADVEGARLAVTILRKRALSSAAAAARSLRRRLELLRAQGHAAASATARACSTKTMTSATISRTRRSARRGSPTPRSSSDG